MRRTLVWVAIAGLAAGCGGGSSSPTSPSQSSGSSDPTVEFDFAENGVMQQTTLTLVLTRQ